MTDNSTEYGVKRGRCITTFSTIQAAYTYWIVTLGSVLLIRDSRSNWRRLIE